MLGGKRERLAMEPGPERAPILIKRYGRRRLYDTASGQYCTLDDLRSWQAKGICFVVIDTETGDDVTLILLA